MRIDRLAFASWVSTDAVAAFSTALGSGPPSTDVGALREYYDAFNQLRLAEALVEYPVDVTEETLGGVECHIVAPEGGVTDDRTLICLHGGSFIWGSGAGAVLEAVPVSAVAGMKVIAVDYRLAPEHVFPAAVDDVLSVYRAVRESTASQIGIYGCSAGAALTAQAVTRMIVDGIDRPGAVGMFHAAGLELAGDSALTSALFHKQSNEADPPTFETLPYFASTTADDPLALPGNHPHLLRHFPPTLLISGTRDFAASSVSVMHRRLLAAGVDAQFLLFDGMWHAHHMFTTLPESRETFAAIARFFDRKLS